MTMANWMDLLNDLGLNVKLVDLQEWRAKCDSSGLTKAESETFTAVYGPTAFSRDGCFEERMSTPVGEEVISAILAKHPEFSLRTMLASMLRYASEEDPQLCALGMSHFFNLVFDFFIYFLFSFFFCIVLFVR